jgi:hypothetical protein
VNEVEILDEAPMMDPIACSVRYTPPFSEESRPFEDAEEPEDGQDPGIPAPPPQARPGKERVVRREGDAPP